jgi:UDP-N-acetyl-D-galactosamine dehydrogenase
MAGQQQAPAHNRTIAVIGLGYVGLPVAVALARSSARTIGFDVNPARIAELRQGRDRTGEIESADLKAAPLAFADSKDALREADFFVVTVPTPIDAARRPDLTALVRASETVGAVLKKGDIVVYESTVYPGATEEECVPVLERVSGLKAGRDFHIGYSPERINPGDKLHRLESIKKVVASDDPATLDIVAAVYGSIVPAGIFRAASVRVAEAAKVIENTQRDLNIALMNELSEIFHSLGLDTADILEAAGTKWNFLPFRPGLVGGHCIGVDPYYLTHKAETVGHHPAIILSGRRVNDQVGGRIARECVRLAGKRGILLRRVVVLGLTFKEDVPDLRNSQVIEIIRTLHDHGVEVDVHDPMAVADEALHEYGVTLKALAEIQPADAVIFAVAHEPLRQAGWAGIKRLLKGGEGIVLDVKCVLPREEIPVGVDLWRL